MNTGNLKIDEKIDTKSLPISSPRPSQIKPKWRQEGARAPKKTKNKIDSTKKGALGTPQPILEQKVANTNPSWLPKSSTNRCKINENNDALQDRVLIRFWWSLGWTMEAGWHQKSMKNDVNFEKRICWICTFSLSENHILLNSGG